MNQYGAFMEVFAKAPFEVYAAARNTLTIQAREIANPTLGTTVLLELNIAAYVAGSDFTIDTPAGDIANRPTTYQLAVRTVDDAGNLYRYVLVPSQTGGILWPAYAGQRLYADNVWLEVWSVAGQATADVQETLLTLGNFTRPVGTVLLNNSYANAGTNTDL